MERDDSSVDVADMVITACLFAIGVAVFGGIVYAIAPSICHCT